MLRRHSLETSENNRTENRISAAEQKVLLHLSAFNESGLGVKLAVDIEKYRFDQPRADPENETGHRCVSRNQKSFRSRDIIQWFSMSFKYYPKIPMHGIGDPAKTFSP